MGLHRRSKGDFLPGTVSLMHLDGELSGASAVSLVCLLSAQLTGGPVLGQDILPNGSWVQHKRALQ